MSAWFQNGYLTWINYVDFIARIVVAAICGAFIGAEREKRLKNAGLRTHIIVSVAAAIMMIVSKYGFFDVVGLEGLRLQADASRIAHGVVSAIGFLGAGVIFVRKESIVGLTTAAGLWATVGVGITIGAGMYGVGVFTTLLMLAIQAVLHRYHMKTKNQMAADVTCNVTKHNMTVVDFEKYLREKNVVVRDLSYKVDDNYNTIVRASLVFPPEDTMQKLLEKLCRENVLDSVQLSPAV